MTQPNSKRFLAIKAVDTREMAERSSPRAKSLKPSIGHLNKHPFLTLLTTLLNDEQHYALRKRVLDLRIKESCCKQVLDISRKNLVGDSVPQEERDDVFVGRAIRTPRLSRIVDSHDYPRVNEHTDEVLQMARDFGLTGALKRTFLNSGYAYVKKCEATCQKEDDVAPEESPEKSFVSRLKNPDAVAQFRLPGFFEEKIFTTRKWRGDGMVDLVKPNTKLPIQQRVNFTKLQHQLGTLVDLVACLRGRPRKILGETAIEGMRASLEELLGKLLITEGDPLHAEAIAAFEHDAELWNHVVKKPAARAHSAQ